MSKYQHSEEGAAPGLRDSEIGPSTVYKLSGLTGNTSRSLNPTERDPRLTKLDGELEAAINAVYRVMAQRYLQFMRGRLAEFDLHNHKVEIKAGMGMACLKVNDVWVDELPNHRNSPVIARLQELDQLIEGCWDWAQHLEGECLNPKKITPRGSKVASEMVPDTGFFMSVYPGTSSGFYSKDGTSKTATSLLELEPDATVRKQCNEHYFAFAKRMGWRGGND